MRILAATMSVLAILGCSGGGGARAPQPPADPFAQVTSTLQAAQSQFPGGLCVEILTPQGVVYSKGFGGFTNQTYVPVASASKFVSATVILRLVDRGVLSLDSRTDEFLKDRSGRPWAGYLGSARVRHLLSFTSGVRGDVPASEGSEITLQEAVLRIYEDQGGQASVPGSTFYYCSPHLRIAARMAEVATGKTWRQIYDEEIRIPLGWGLLSTYGGGSNPNPAGSLLCTGQEYVRFLMLQLRQGQDGSNRLLSESLVAQQRQDGFGPGTVLAYSPYMLMQRANHYGFGAWVEAQNGQAPSASNPIQRVSSTGKFGWAPWVEIGEGGPWAGLIMCQQPDQAAAFVPSENLKLALAPLVSAALAQNPAVVRTVP